MKKVIERARKMIKDDKLVINKHTELCISFIKDECDLSEKGDVKDNDLGVRMEFYRQQIGKLNEAIENLKYQAQRPRLDDNEIEGRMYFSPEKEKVFVYCTGCYDTQDAICDGPEKPHQAGIEKGFLVQKWGPYKLDCYCCRTCDKVIKLNQGFS